MWKYGDYEEKIKVNCEEARIAHTFKKECPIINEILWAYVDFRLLEEHIHTYTKVKMV